MKMYKMFLLPNDEGNDEEIQSEVIFQNGDSVYLSCSEGLGEYVLSGRCFNINENKKGIESITYCYDIFP